MATNSRQGGGGGAAYEQDLVAADADGVVLDIVEAGCYERGWRGALVAEERFTVDVGSAEATRQRHIARFATVLPEYRARIEWSAEQLRVERLLALRELLSVAVSRSVWHRERLADFDVGQLSEGERRACRS